MSRVYLNSPIREAKQLKSSSNHSFNIKERIQNFYWCTLYRSALWVMFNSIFSLDPNVLVSFLAL